MIDSFLTISALTIGTSIISSCMSASSQPDADIVLLEKKLARTNKKLEEIYQAIGEIKNGIKDNQEAIQAFDKKFYMPKKAISDNTAKSSDEISLHKTKSGHLSTKTKIAKASTPEEIYKKAIAAYRQKRFKEAVPIFQSIADMYSDHGLADNALYWEGESLYSLKDFSAAAKTFKQLIDKYPKGNKAPDAYLKLGLAYLSLGHIKDGRRYLKAVIKKYPFNPTAAKAEKMLHDLNNLVKVK